MVSTKYLDTVTRKVAGIDPDELGPSTTAVVRGHEVRLRIVQKASAEAPEVRVDLIWINDGHVCDWFQSETGRRSVLAVVVEKALAVYTPSLAVVIRCSFV